MIDIVDRLGFDATRCELQFSNGVASNIEDGIAEIKRLRAALVLVRGIISEASMTGFNCHDGDWAERLFASQGVTHAALHVQQKGDGK